MVNHNFPTADHHYLACQVSAKILSYFPSNMVYRKDSENSTTKKNRQTPLARTLYMLGSLTYIRILVDNGTNFGHLRLVDSPILALFLSNYRCHYGMQSIVIYKSEDFSPRSGKVYQMLSYHMYYNPSRISFFGPKLDLNMFH